MRRAILPTNPGALNEKEIEKNFKKIGQEE